MKFGFYPKLALDGIRKNKRLYVPYILTCVGMVFMYYILASLAVSPIVGGIRGAWAVQMMLDFGRYVVAIFAGIFLFYTNSFLNRRRKKEFGLYNILGMSKGNIAHLLIWETLLTAAVALVGGAILGIVLYKLAELALVRILGGEVVYDLTIAWSVLPGCILFFALIFVLLFAFTLLRVRLSNPVELIRSENTGEKPPKANWLLGLLGVVLLGVAYFISVSIENPVSALVWFFVAVILVIVATYLIFIAGSVLICRLLQKNRDYYYKANHFVSVSAMVYRMKRNGAGLASICVLATMVLVMLSSAGSLVAGVEDILVARYPKDVNFSVALDSGITPEQEEQLVSILTEGVEPENVETYHYVTTVAALEGGELNLENTNYLSADAPYQVYILGLEDYNRINGEDETLASGELLLSSNRGTLALDRLTIPSMGTYTVKEEISFAVNKGDAIASNYGGLFLVVPDLADCQQLLHVEQQKDGQNSNTQLEFWYGFDLELDAEAQRAYYEATLSSLSNVIQDMTGDSNGAYSFGVRDCEKQEFYGLVGGLLFLGVLLSVVFLFATVLIIYYKQISEGYEDAARFEIMQKVGMTKGDIRRSINSQMLTVFFLPLALAALHIAFAFPIIRKLLLMFRLNNTVVFLLATLVCFLVFALFYAVVYKITSNVYFKLVSQQE